VIAKPNHAAAARFKPRSPLSIMHPVRLLLVLRAIELDHESMRKTDEVDDVRAERRLAAKLVAVDLGGAQVTPETLLGA
jgi:hypothetical protein